MVLEKTHESPLDCKEIHPVHPKGDQSWVFIGRTDDEAETPNTLATWYEELTYWKRPWCWERLKAGGEGDDKGWDGWMASPTQWTWVWVSSGSWWWIGRPGVLRFMGSQRVRNDWTTELSLSDYKAFYKEGSYFSENCEICVSAFWWGEGMVFDWYKSLQFLTMNFKLLLLGSNTSFLIKIGAITVSTFLPMRNKFSYSCSIKIHALGFSEHFESFFCLLLVVGAFCLQRVDVWREVRGIW